MARDLGPGGEEQPGHESAELAWTVLLVLLALAVFSTAAYALYLYFIRPRPAARQRGGDAHRP